jgi:(2Fe-2S) ferredoxin
MPVAVLLAKSAISATPIEEMARLASQLEATGRVSKAVYAFSEQGFPSLKETVQNLREEGQIDILTLPLLVPMEPNFHHWITRTLQRWHVEVGGEWPRILVGRGLSEATDDLRPMLSAMLDSALLRAPAPQNVRAATEGSVVSDRKYRVLVCQGGPCNQAGAAVLWGHLRNAQASLKLADAGDGMRSAKTSCLGPCALAPVLQVYPDGVFYGGVDEQGIDRIIHEHLENGRIVEDLAYRPAEGKQTLRAKAESSP